MKFKFLVIYIIGLISLVSGCSSSNPVYFNRVEYVPPVTPDQVDCINVITDAFNSCKEGENIETDLCVLKARDKANEAYADALSRYEERMSEIQKDNKRQDADRDKATLQAQSDYHDCLDKNKELKLKYGTQFSQDCTRFINQISNLDSTAAIQGITSNLQASFISKPELADYIHDSHCYSNNNCLSEYNNNYEECQGKVVKTSICVGNCE